MRIIVYKIPEQEKVLYNLGQLLEKLCQNNKIGILCKTEITDFIDKNLWTFSKNAFLPHDIATGDPEKDNKQPILISEKLEFLNRDILCLFTKEDLFYALEHQSLIDKTNNIVFMVQLKENSFYIDIDEIKKTNVDCVDVFQKKDKKWEKVNN